MVEKAISDDPYMEMMIHISYNPVVIDEAGVQCGSLNHASTIDEMDTLLVFAGCERIAVVDEAECDGLGGTERDLTPHILLDDYIPQHCVPSCSDKRY